MRFLPYAFAVVLLPLTLSADIPQLPQQASPVSGQKDTYTLKVNPRLVVLDVVVTDKQGNPVTNLKREDFEVQEDKQPQSIDSFDPPAAHALPSNVVIHSTAELDRLAPNATTTILVLDEYTSTFDQIYFAHQAIQQYLKAQPQLLSQPTMLVAVNIDKMIVLHDYTQDRNALLTALNRHNAGPADRSGRRAINGVNYSGGPLEAAYRSLTQVAQATAGHPGHKNVIWVGHGMPIGLFPLPDVALRLHIALQKQIDLLIASRVTLSTIDLRGPGFDHAPIGDSVVTFAEVAVATGGKNLYNRNDVNQMIDTSVRNGDSSYALSYIPTSESTAQGAFRHIRVIVKDPSLRVTTRTGYYPNPGKEPGWVVAQDMARWHPTPKNTIDQSIADTKLVYDGIPLTLSRAGKPGQIVVHMKTDALPWVDHGAGQPRTSAIQVSCVSFDAKGKVLTHEGSDTQVLSPTSASSGAASANVSLSVTFTPNPRAAQLRIIVQATDTGKVGAANLDLTPK